MVLLQISVASRMARICQNPGLCSGAETINAVAIRGVNATPTLLNKLARLRHQVIHFPILAKTMKKLFSSNLENTLTFLYDSLLPTISNAVEQANRLQRKMQKSIYRVRTREYIRQRIAVDIQWDVHIDTQLQTTSTLHRNRANKSQKTYEKRKIV